MAELFASGRVIDCILGLMLLELLAMVWWRHRSGHGLALTEALATLGAGAALLLALRAALAGSGWQQPAMWLLVALGAHVADIIMRLARRRIV